MGISLWQLLIVLVIVLLLFGTKKLKNIGSDLGGAVRGFKSAVKDGGEEADDALLESEKAADEAQIMDGEAVAESTENVAEKQHERV